MLKFTNTANTAASFNASSFSLDAPEDWASIGDGPTRDAVIAWLDAGNKPEPADALPAQPAIDQIRALEAQASDVMAKASRQFMIAVKLKEADANGGTHDALMKADADYNKLVTLKALIVPLREQMRAEAAEATSAT